MTTKPLVVNFGGGDNSSALICYLVEQGIRPDMIVFADTGDEMPHTYAAMPAMADYLARHGFPPLEVIRRVIVRGRNVGVRSLEVECWRNETLPSRVFGRAGCSTKWKKQPADKAVKERFRGHIKGGGLVQRAIGFDIGEVRRCKFQPTPPFEWIYPLVDARMTRDDCVAIIKRHGLMPPGKSSCFYCPSMRKPEIRELADRYPDLAKRALDMEAMALATGKLRAVDGLGRHWSWASVIDEHRHLKVIEQRADEPEEGLDLPCGEVCGT